MTEKLFRHKKPNKDKLLAYGFCFDGDRYTYTRPVLQNEMELLVSVDKVGNVGTRLTDTSSGEEYILHLVRSASGSYIGQVRSEYEAVLSHIAESCFDGEVFKAKQTKRVIAYFKDRYGDELEHLWADAPDNAIVRRQDNRKWYAAILTVSRRKLGFDSDERVEIIDLHAKSEDIPRLVDNVKFFPGFHMNKKHWITVCLDGSLSDAELFEKIDESYALGKKQEGT